MIQPKKYEYQGGQATIAEIAERSGQPANRIRRRIARGWSVEDAPSRNKMSSSTAGRIGKRRSPWVRPYNK